MVSCRAVGLALLSCATLFACGSSDSSLFPSGDGTTGGSGGPSTGGNGSDGRSTDSFSSDPVGTNAACVTSRRSASLPTVNLVIMYDKSGSMGDPAEGGDPSTKWVPVNAGMKAFFSDPASAGYSASLQFFPAPGNLAATCNFAYSQPKVPLTSLTVSAPLTRALDAATPQGGTPTLPALRGALSYAQQVAAQQPDAKTVVVLVTDGEPGLQIDGKFVEGCANNDIRNVADAARTSAAGSPAIPTYVIGVGPSLDKLNEVAAAGGTGKALMVSVSNPAQTKSDLQKAFEAIRGQVKVGCDFEIPAPPQGQLLDKGRVNIGYTSGAGHETPLVYSAQCVNDTGWRYDDPAHPRRIELCSATCDVGKGDPNGKLTLAFGCITNGFEK